MRENAYKFTSKDFPFFIIALAVVTAISFMFPHHQGDNYTYEVGEKWQYDNLYANQDFSFQFDEEVVPDSMVTVQVSKLKGDLLIAKLQELTPYNVRVIDNYISIQPKANKGFFNRSWLYFLGYFILTTLILGALLFYARRYYPSIFDSLRSMCFLMIWPLLFSTVVFIISRSDGLSPYIIPFCVVPIVVLNFFDVRLALILHIVVVLIASFLSGLGYEFTFLQILAGIVTVLSVTETRYWNKFFVDILIILVTYLIGFFGLALINSGSFTDNELPVFAWLAVNAIFLLLAYPFIPIIEKVFGFVSNISLAELGDMNKPLLKELSLMAPGTLQHSLQVANLAESAAERIGANSLLVKTAALYHDIGKIPNAQYFIENAQGNNRHEELNNFESAKIIIDHVSEGVQKAKKAKLPEMIIDFIRTHHGTTRVEYFYRNQVNLEPDREFDESLFRYSGPRPQTKEQTILMLADSIEAASKSLKNPTGQDIDQLIEKIVSYKIDQHQLVESQLSFHELEECTSVFKNLLRSIYHVRVEYPDDQKNTAQEKD